MKYLGKNGLRVKNNKVWHEGNFDPSDKSDKGHKHTKSEITDFPTSLPANGGNADTVGGKRPSDFTLQSYTDSNIYPVNNVAMVNLGRPTVTEMALIDAQATNKIWFHPIEKMIFEQSDDGITFYERSDISDLNKRKLVSGNSNALINIPKGKYFRITIFPRSYVYLNWIYMYFSTSGNRARFKCEKKRDDGDWITHFDYTNPVSGWPGHIFIPHSTIAFSPNSTSGHYNQVRITIATDEQTNTYSNMTLYGLEWWGGYPTGIRTIYSHDEYRNVTFPEELKAKTFKNASGKEVAYQNDIPTKLSELNKDINFDERYYTESEVDNKLNSKVDKINGKGLSTEDYTTVEKNKLSGIEAGANKYTHPSTHPASMITESTSRRFVSDTEKSNWNKKAEISDIPTKVGQLENDKNYVTQAELGDAGYGDMLKSIYDKNNDGIVDRADNADKLDGKSASEFQQLTNGGAYGIFPSTASTMVGNEYNILLYAYKRGYNVTQTGSTTVNLNSLFDGKLEPTYSPDGVNPDDPLVITISGLPNIHTQTGGVFGWTCRYYYPTLYKIEAYDSYRDKGWKVILDSSDKPNPTKELLIPIYPKHSGALTQFRITIYDTIGAIGANGFRRVGLSEVFFCHPEAVSVNEYLDYVYSKLDHTHDERYYTKTETNTKINEKPIYHVGKTPPTDNNVLWINTNL